MAASVDDLLTRILMRLLDEAYDWSYPRIPSRYLQSEMVKLFHGVGAGYAEGSLYIDAYWAIYLHDGRNGISKAPLVWFRNPEDDPRLGTKGYLDRYTEWRSLTDVEWKYWIRQNRLAVKRGQPLPMIVRWYGVAGVTGSYWFDPLIGMAGFRAVADRIVLDELTIWLEDELDPYLIPITSAASGTIF